MAFTTFDTYEAIVKVQNGNASIPHTVRITADSSFSAQQLLRGQYGQNNVISMPIKVS